MFKWKDDFSVKVTDIDDQHKRLFEIGNEINELLKNFAGQDTYDEIMTLIEELVNYTKYHFDHEEKLMAEYGYPDIEDHIQEHNKFVDYLESIDFDSVDSNQQGTLKELMNFVTSWVLKHVIDTDMKYSDFLSNAMK